MAYEALGLIQYIYRRDNELKDLKSGERKRKRKSLIRPLVNDFFRWIREVQPQVSRTSETGKALTYCLNQEKYLRVFLENPEIPMDNNAAERAIRPFCVGKKNWKLIDTTPEKIRRLWLNFICSIKICIILASRPFGYPNGKTFVRDTLIPE